MKKSSTPLNKWFYAMYIMVQTKGTISIKHLQTELEVTYKTAWRMHKSIIKLMKQKNGDLTAGSIEEPELSARQRKTTKMHKWTLLNTVVISVVHKESTREKNT